MFQGREKLFVQNNMGSSYSIQPLLFATVWSLLYDQTFLLEGLLLGLIKAK
jgi:hypothetical protein